MSMKKLLIAGLAAASLLLSAAAFADNKIGILDVRQVLQKSPQVAALQKKMQSEFGGRQKQIEAAQQQLQQNAEKLNRDSAVLSASDKDTLTKKVQTEQQTLRDMQMSFQKDVYTKQNEQMQGILNQVQTIVAKIAKEKQLTLVVAKEAVIYAGDSVDITNEVVAALQ